MEGEQGYRRLVVSPGRAPDANTWETAVVVLALALVVAGAQTVFRAREALKAK
jgi:hypothetical protein